MERILEVGCGESPDRRSTIRTDIRSTAAIDVFASATDLPFESESLDGIIAYHTLEHLEDPSEFFAEAVRVLKPDGWVEFEVPLGALHRIDPTHRTEWTYETPEYFVSGGRWDYYYDFDLSLESREARVWLDAPLVHYLSPLFRVLARRSPGVWLSETPWSAGVLTVRMTKRATAQR